MAVLKRVGLLLLLVLLLLLAVLAYVTMTHGGLQRLFSLGQSYATGELVVGKSSGALIGPARFEDVSYINEGGASVKINEARFDWKPKKLLSRSVQVDDLSLQGVDIYLPPPSEKQGESQPFQLRDLALPVSADIKKIHISALNIYPFGATEPFVIDDIKLTAQGQQSSLKLVDLQVASPQLQISMNGSLDTSGDWPVNLEPQWQFTHKQLGQFSGTGSVTGTTKSLVVNHQVTGPGAAEPLSVIVDAEVNDVTAELSWLANIAINSDDLGVFAPAASGIPLTVNANSTGSLQDYSVSGALQTRHPVTGEVDSNYDLQGDLEALNIKQLQLMFEDSPTKLSAQGSLALSDLNSDIIVSWQDLRWPLPQEQALVTQSPKGQLKVTGVPDNLQVVSTIDISQPEVGDLVVDASITRTPDIIAINSLQINTGNEEAAIEVNGQVNVAQSSVALEGDLTQFSWPLVVPQGDALINIPQGSFTVDGPFDGYRVGAEIEVEGAQVPEGKWNLSALGDQQQLSEITLKGETLAGVITGAGLASWAPQPDWQIDLTGNGLNPAEKWPGLQGDVGFALNSSGQLGNDGLSVETTLKEVTGSYRNQPLSGSGVIVIDKGTTNIKQLVLGAGAVSVNANGTVGESLDLNWDLNAQSIGSLVPGVQGDIKVAGVVSGTRATPMSEFTLAIDSLKSDAVSIVSGEGTGVIDLSGGEKSTFKLDLKDVEAAGQVVSKVSVSGQGTPAEHSAVITADSELVDFALNATGRVKDNAWQGTLEQLDLTDTEFGDWVLQQPVPVTASANGVNASAVCLESKPSKVCIDASWDEKNGVESIVDITSLDTLRFKDYLPPDITLDALVSGQVDLSVRPGGAPVVKGALALPGGQLDYLDAGEPRTTTLGENTVEFDYSDDSLKSRVDLNLGEIGTLSSVANIGELSGARNLSGSVKTDLKDLALFSAFAPGLDSFKGSLNTSMQLAGTVDAPKVIGDSDLDALVLEVPSVAMKLIDGKVVARSDGKGGLILSGSAVSGDGKIDLNGKFDPATQDADVTIKGENFQVANAKNQRLLVSPDLRVIKKGDDITITGKVHVPTAFYQAGAEAALVRESRDVVLVNNDNDTDAQSDASRMTINVEVTLGDDIRVKAGQFDGALAGAVTIEQQPGGVPTGVGAIEVVSGDFLVYGQKLTMESGRILFGGGPVTNPALELDVAREVPAYEVKAGARIRGTAQAPLLQLQSDPAQTDANTLSYILLGRPVGTAGVSYTLGKYITPDLYVSYGIDLISKSKTYNLRYKFTELLSLIAAKSDVSSADLIYTFER